MNRILRVVIVVSVIISATQATPYARFDVAVVEEKKPQHVPERILYDLDGDPLNGLPSLCQNLSDALRIVDAHIEGGNNVSFALYREYNTTRDRDGAVLCGATRERHPGEPHRLVEIEQVVRIEWLCFDIYRQGQHMSVPRFVIVALLVDNPIHEKYKVLLAVHDILPDNIEQFFDVDAVTNMDICAD